MVNADKKETSYSMAIGYDKLDPFKVNAQKAGEGLVNADYDEELTSRGESAAVFWPKKGDGSGIAHVIEGLGTKNIAAELYYRQTKNPIGHFNVALDTVAMKVNDLITIGALPLNVNMHIAVGTADWMLDADRAAALIAGFREGAILSGAFWNGGETPTLRGMVDPDFPVLSGSCVGTLARKDYLNGRKIKDKDVIVLIASNGIHANGLTNGRKVADMLEDGYMTLLENGSTYGESLLRPTVNYVRLMRALQNAGSDVHYVVHITGHGWRKLMRANENFTYTVHHLPAVDPLFSIIQKTLGTDYVEMHETYNMGAGLALYVPESEAATVLSVAEENGYDAWIGGEVTRSESKAVVLTEPDIIFSSDTLSIRS